MDDVKDKDILINMTKISEKDEAFRQEDFDIESVVKDKSVQKNNKKVCKKIVLLVKGCFLNVDKSVI